MSNDELISGFIIFALYFGFALVVANVAEAIVTGQLF